MDRPNKRLIALAAAIVPAAAAGVACAWYWLQPAPPSPSPSTVAVAPTPQVEHCHRAAELLYDVHWAAACFKTHDANDCMLPDAQAAKVNAILASEHARCMAVETQAKAGQ